MMKAGKVYRTLGESSVVILIESEHQLLHFQQVVSSELGLWPCMAAYLSMQQ